MPATPLTPELLRRHPEVLAALHAAARHERADVVASLLRDALAAIPAPRGAGLRTAGVAGGPRR